MGGSSSGGGGGGGGGSKRCCHSGSRCVKVTKLIPKSVMHCELKIGSNSRR
jgi:hypothetical protein